jgi:hypothetical protein
LTNSIENILSGDSFHTDVSLFTIEDSKLCIKKNSWNFDWKIELKEPARDVFKLTIANSTSVIQGLISLEVKEDHVFIHLIENAPFNKGKSKVYAGVAGNLVAHACKLSFQRGNEGNVSFIAKSQLINHYVESLGVFHFGGRLMVIERDSALKLINKYFKNLLI